MSIPFVSLSFYLLLFQPQHSAQNFQNRKLQHSILSKALVLFLEWNKLRYNVPISNADMQLSPHNCPFCFLFSALLHFKQMCVSADSRMTVSDGNQDLDRVMAV